MAARLVDEHGKPVIALGRDEHGKYVGSGRSIQGFDVTSALRDCAEQILKFGGHPMACGLTIEGDAKFEAFDHAFRDVARKRLEGVELVPTIEIEEAVQPEEATIPLADLITQLEPYGEGNPRPHLRLMVAGERGTVLALIGFGFGDRLPEFAPGTNLEAVIEIAVNEWNGRRSPQGRIVDLRQA